MRDYLMCNTHISVLQTRGRAGRHVSIENYRNIRDEPSLRRYRIPDVWQAEISNRFVEKLGNQTDNEHFHFLALWLWKKGFLLTEQVTFGRGMYRNRKLCEISTTSMIFRSLGSQSPLIFERKK